MLLLFNPNIVLKIAIFWYTYTSIYLILYKNQKDANFKKYFYLEYFPKNTYNIFIRD